MNNMEMLENFTNNEMEFLTEIELLQFIKTLNNELINRLDYTQNESEKDTKDFNTLITIDLLYQGILENNGVK